MRALCRIMYVIRQWPESGIGWTTTNQKKCRAVSHLENESEIRCERNGFFRQQVGVSEGKNPEK